MIQRCQGVYKRQTHTVKSDRGEEYGVAEIYRGKLKNGEKISFRWAVFSG